MSTSRARRLGTLGSTSKALPEARRSQTVAVAVTLRLAFTRRRDRTPARIGYRLLVALTFPGYLATTHAGVPAQQFYFRPVESAVPLAAVELDR